MIAQSARGVVCTPEPQATEAGLDILDAGGSAAEAVLAASATLAVTYPHMTGLGGDAIWLLSDGARVQVVSGIGQAGTRLPEAGIITERGPSSAATTAGALRSWSLVYKMTALDTGLQIPWPRLLERPIELARKGVPVSASHAFWADYRKDLVAQCPDLQRLCCDPNGELLPIGSLLKRPDLARTLEQIGRAGPDDFYDGELSRELGTGLERLGTGLSRRDLAATKAYLKEPARIRYRNGWLYNAPPPTQGIYTLAALNSLNNFDLRAMGAGSSSYYHSLVEAIKLQLVRRNQELCDPRVETFDWRHRLSESQGREDSARIDTQKARPWPEVGQPADTVWLAASDSRGRTACLLQSLFHDFGSGCCAGDTGVLWLNRAASFNPAQSHPNAWRPGKRPAHTLNPSAWLSDDGEQFYFGTQGGDGQPQTQMVLATQLIDFRHSLEEALLAPRFLLGRSFFGARDNLKLEKNLGAATGVLLSKLGHEVEWVQPLSPIMGEAGIIHIDASGQKAASHDPRGAGTALGQV